MKHDYFAALIFVALAAPIAAEAQGLEPLSFNDHRQCIAALEWAYDMQDQMGPNLAAARGSAAAQTVKIGSELSSATQNSATNLASALSDYISNLTAVCAALSEKR